MTKSKLHDALYDTANRVLAAANPCNIKIGEDGKASCNNPYYSKDGFLCCGGCPNLTPTGCSVRSLGCKLWLCQHVMREPPGTTAFVALAALRSVAVAGGIKMLIRADKAFEVAP